MQVIGKFAGVWFLFLGANVERENVGTETYRKIAFRVFGGE